MAPWPRTSEVLSGRSLQPAPPRHAASLTSPRLSFVVPAHNEAATLPITIPVLIHRLANAPGAEIIIVENGSSDTTFEVASELARSSSGVAVIVTRSAPGIGAAYRAGIALASGDHVICSAADLPFGFTDLEGYLDAGCPAMAIGSKAHQDSVVERSAMRSLMSFVFLVLRRIVLGMRVGDPQGTFLMERSLAQTLAPRCAEDGFAFTTELTALAGAAGVVPIELPIVLEPERRASTVHPVRDGVRVIEALLRIRRRAQWIRRENTRAWAASASRPTRFAARQISAHGLRRGVIRAGLLASLLVISIPAALVMTTLLASALPERWDAIGATIGLVVVGVAVAFALRREEQPEPVSDVAVTRTVPSITPPAAPFTGRLIRRAGELAVFVMGAMVMIAPASAQLTNRYAGYSDNHYWFWMSWRAGQALRHGQSVLHYPDVVWPYGLDIKAADGFLPTMVGGFWNLIIPNPVLAFNLAIVTALVSTACAGAWLAARVTGERWIHIVTGLALMTATVMSVRVNIHYNLLFTFPAVLLVGRAVEIAAGDRIRVVRDAGLIALAYLSSGYFMAYGLIAAALLVILAPGSSLARVKSHVLRGSVAIALVVVMLSPFLIAKLKLEHDEARAGAIALSDESSEHSADPFSFLQPPPGTLALPGPVVAAQSYSPFAQEATTFPGIVLVGGLIALVAMRSRLRRALLLTAAGLWLLSLGPRLSINGYIPISRDFLPSALLTRLPGMRGMRDPNRAGFLIVPIAGLAFALCMERARGVLDGRTRRITIGVLLAAMVVGLHVPVSTARASGASAEVRTAMREWGASTAPGAVLILPDQCTFTLLETRLQLDLRRPIVGCQGFSASLPFASGMAAYRSSDAWAALRCDPDSLGATVVIPEFAALTPNAEAIGRLRSELDVGLVVFDRVNNCPRVSEEVLDLLQHNASLLADDGRFALFEVPASVSSISNVEGHP